MGGRCDGGHCSHGTGACSTFATASRSRLSVLHGWTRFTFWRPPSDQKKNARLGQTQLAGVCTRRPLVSCRPVGRRDGEMRSVENSLDVGVTCYGSRASSWIVYGGSFAWFVVFGAVNGMLIATATDTWRHDDGYKEGVLPFYAIAFGFHVGVFFLQTLDAAYFDRTFWPLQAAMWGMQIITIVCFTITSTYSLTIRDKDRTARTAANVGALAGQVLSIACHIAVTLEYMLRRCERTLRA